VSPQVPSTVRWDGEKAKKKRGAFLISVKAYSGLMDMILALLPWKVVWSLQMKTREKIGVGLAMSLGML